MLRLLKFVPVLSWLRTASPALLACCCLAPNVGRAQAPNDNFANPIVLVGIFGTTNGDNTGATKELNEPSHAGLPPRASLWYQWTATEEGQVEFDTFGSSIDTVLAVYTGTALANLNMVVANDDVNSANPRRVVGGPSPDPYVHNPYLGPSGVKFNAKLGTTYYIAVDGYTKSKSSLPGSGPFTLSWAYHPSGIFRFTDDNFFVSEAESGNPRSGTVRLSPKGARVTITRLFGSSGKVTVPFSTVDGIAILPDPINWIFATDGTDYNTPANTNLVFEDGEITKSFIIHVIDDGMFFNDGSRFGLCAPNRAFNVLLGTPTLDPLEDTSYLSPPRTEPLHANGQVNIYDFDTDPLFGDPTLCPAFITKIGDKPYNGVAQPERIVFRCTEDVGTASMTIYPIGGDPMASCEIHYAYDAPLPSLNTAYNNFDLQAGSDYATPDNDAPPFNGADDGPLGLNGDFTRNSYEDVGPNFDSQRIASQNNYGTLKWAGVGRFTPRTVRIPINNDGVPEFNEDIAVVLFDIGGHDQDMFFGWNTFDQPARMTILYNDYPAGALDDAHNPDLSLATDPPNNTRPGADGLVNALVVQPDDKTIIGGDFSSYDATPRYGIARVNVDGQLDTGFDPGSGVAVQVGDFVSSLSLTTNGSVVIGGSFSSFNGSPRYGIARLNSDGSLDTAFNPGTGVDGTVWAVKALPDGKVLISGDFTTVNGIARLRIARLNVDGSVDPTFDPGLNGPNGTINAFDVAADGSIFIGGDFTSVGGLTRKSIAQLGTNGVVMPSFDPITGVDGPIFALVVQGDGTVLVGGAFANIQSRHCGNLARFNTNGILDLTFDASLGADDAVYTISLQNDGRIFVGGLFTSINGTRRIGVARMYPNGAVDTHWLDTAYCQYAGLHKVYNNANVDAKNFLLATGVQSDGKLMIGGSFLYVGGGRFDSAVMTNSPAPADDVPQSRDTYRVRANFARLLGGDTEGPGSLNLASTNYSASENQGFLYVKLARSDGTLGTVEATFSVPPRDPGPGVGQSGVDYFYNRVNPFWDSSWTGTRMRSDGLWGTNNNDINIFSAQVPNSGLNDVTITIPHLLGSQGDRSIPFKLDVPSYADVFWLGGENIPLGAALGHSSASLSILEADLLRGVISFSSPSYSVNENGTNAIINLIRTNGSSGQVTVRFATTNGTAVAGPGHDYLGVTNTVTFRDGQTSTNVSVPIIDDSIVQNADKTVNLYLLNPGNGATLGLANAVLYIVDNDFLPGRVNLTSTNYFFNETDGAAVMTITRSGGSLGVLNVQFATSDATAVSGVNYTGTNGTLHWEDGDSSTRNIAIPIIQDGLVTTPDKKFNFALFNSSIANALGPRTNAGVTIINQDFYGTLQFTAPSYNVNENGGYATITVVRQNGVAGTVTANYSTADTASAVAGVNYTSTSGTLTFGPGVVSQSFTVPILDDGFADPLPFFFTVGLSGFTPSVAIAGAPTNTSVNIVDNQSFNQPPGDGDQVFDTGAGFNDDVLAIALQPGGRILAAGNFTTANGLPAGRLARLTINGSLDAGFLNGLAGANGPVRAMINQTDTRIVVGGAFTTMDSVVRNYIARLNYDGSIDTSFNPGSGADAPVYAVAETAISGTRKLLVGGAFNTLNGVLRSGIVRLNDDGSVDSAFNNGVGANGTVYAMAVYPTNSLFAGRVVIGGDFTTVNGIVRSRIARLNLDGSVDITFNPGTGADSTVLAIALQSDGKVLLGGSFTNLNGSARSHLARLNGDGSVDGSFLIGVGANDTVQGLALQPDNRIVAVGNFTRASGVSRGRITRLMPNGTLDPTINFGSGANNFVAAVAIQPDEKLVIGGGFTQVEGVPAGHIARLFGGSVVGSGSFRFELGGYQVNENATNVLVNVVRTGGTSGPLPDGTGDITVDFATSDGTAVAGINYSNVALTLDFPAGETLQTLSIPIIDDNQITPDLTVNLALSNPSPPATLGPQSTVVLTIVNVDSSVSFSASAYSRNENAVDGLATIHVVRSGSSQNIATVLFTTTSGGTAVPGVNYTPVTNLVTFQPGQTDVIVQIPIFYDPQANGDKTVTLELSNPGSAVLVTPSEAVLTIVDVDQGPGRLSFSAPVYNVSEAGTNVTLTVVRTNGHSGNVSAAYATAPGTATPGVRYVSTNGFVSFTDGETSKPITVRILNDNIVLGNQYFNVSLTNVTGGATLGAQNSAIVNVIEDETGLSFSSSLYVVSETTSQLTLTVLRPSGTNVASQVSYATTNGTAVAGVNYTAASGVLSFIPGETFKTITLTLSHDTNVTGNLTFAVNLSNPINGQLAFPSTANVLMLDAEAGISFTNSALTVLENVTNVILPVICSNPNAEPIFVNYATADGISDNPAFAGVDYVPASGTLAFTNGITTNYIVVGIIDNLAVDSSRDFSVNLTGPSARGVLIAPFIETITISNNDSGLSFSSSAYDVFKNGGSATIGVVRTGYTNSVVTVNYTTQDGTATNGQDYVAASGTLTFTNGQTATNFTVTVIDSTVIKPNRTLNLLLSGVGGNASLVPPSTATLTIHDNSGSLIVPAGAVITSESLTVNNVIEPGETVTLLFGLRNAAGTNTGNLVATLLATNGVTSPSGAQSYGTLVSEGPSVSRSFSFTASGTNGQTIVATFHLQDGAIDRGTALFSYVLGTTSSFAATNGLITINDNTNATPYPSTINVSGLGGSITKVTVTLTNVNHFFPADIAAMLLSPGGQKVLLMANSGSAPMQNVTLTFDDTAANALPQSGAIPSGTYRPNGVTLVTTFPAPAPPAPYATNLSVFNNSNPNGLWSLFVLDDSPGSAGAISNGWFLNITTLNPVAPAADVVAGMAVTSATTVSNLVYRVNLSYNISVTNAGPATAGNVSVSDVFPTNATFVSATPAGYTLVSNVLTFTNIGSLARDAFANLNVTISVPAVPTVVSNTVIALAASTADPNLANNRVTLNTPVTSPTVDLSLSLAGTPNPILLGDTLKYTLIVSNNINLSPAAGVKLTNVLSPSVLLLSNVPAASSINGSILTFDLGVIANGARTTNTIYVRPLAAGTVTNNAFVGSVLTDQFKANNSASVKTIVEQLTVSLSAHNLTLSWPGDVGTYVLETTTTLQPPNWVQVTSPPPQFGGNQYSVTVGTTNSLRFFRLRKQ